MRALEFYSGIGGLRCALRRAAPQAAVVAAFDINNVANDVYAHNFGDRPRQSNIERIPLSLLESMRADVWLLSPPCQPYTRQGLKLDANDHRASSFLALMGMLAQMMAPPDYLLVENVVGFESSLTRSRLVETLRACHYQVQEYILSPVQLRIPYSRPRYFCLAKRGRFATQPAEPHSVLFEPPPLGQLPTYEDVVPEPIAAFLDPEDCPDMAEGPSGLVPGPNAPPTDDPTPVDATGDRLRPTLRAHKSPHSADCADPGFDQFQPSVDFGDPTSSVARDGALCTEAADGHAGGAKHRNLKNANGLAGTRDRWRMLRVPVKTLAQCGNVIDVVAAEGRRCNCFTKSYTRYAKGTGSVLATRNTHLLQTLESTRARNVPIRGDSAGAGNAVGDDVGSGVDRRQCDSDGGSGGDAGCNGNGVTPGMVEALREMGVRYFSPREVARLHSFPPGFAFPPHVSPRQRYLLLGNSLNVSVVAHLLAFLFMDPKDQSCLDASQLLASAPLASVGVMACSDIAQ
ncbi:unnamed protein product [Ostreobium quekettii]|uniref:S-adenosyl-L-methionine-dependent methyltransferase n=1 Tax=Ostreobium quekettii TaxID=121088 RepID=A0A8S1JHL2_9CHLO|nr:unnamed protein product [Ostreobium quekettii]|eukprot:evm.model.scf_1269.2 EVM.evm.TU.scf_1269.2   scf_1269:6578-12421(-)